MNGRLIIVAELFTGSKDADDLFVRELGIDYLIREAMVECDPAGLAHKISDYSASPLGQLFHQTHVTKEKGKALFYDCTHDNPTPGEKRTVLDAIPNAALTAFSACAIGSVRGYDELVPKHLNVVHESRSYDSQLHPFMEVKQRLYELRAKMERAGCTEVQSALLDNGVIRVLRLDPSSLSGFCLYARTAYTSNQDSISVDLTLQHHIVQSVSMTTPILGGYHWDEKVITGFECAFDDKQIIPKSALLEMAPGSIAIAQINLKDKVAQAIERLNVSSDAAFYEAMRGFALTDYNEVFYKCAEEEYDTYKRGVYVVPGHGDLQYAGFAGVFRLIEKIDAEKLEYHPLVQNMRQGRWLLDYYEGRLASVNTECDLDAFRKVYKEVMTDLRVLPVEYTAKYAIEKLKQMSSAMRKSFVKLHCTEEIQQGDMLVQELALCLGKLYGKVPSTGLGPTGTSASLSAGLPHFTIHHMRCWGRDTFISFRGLFLLTLRDSGVAREHLRAFAACMHRGLIPNLLDAQRFPRYNARDATWFFLSSLADYIDLYGPTVLDEQVKMRFNGDGGCQWEDGYQEQKTICMIVQEILEAHWKGIEFREWRAGPELDSVMRGEGFNVRVWTDPETGLVHGGNEWNCGTWMDKMGSAGSNHGVPSTSRHGASIELNALCFKALSKLGPHLEEASKWEEWKRKLKGAFEGSYFNGEYYVDTLDSESGLRPNQLIAMAEAPELFNSKNALAALDVVLEKLWDRGVRTLCPEDPRYRPIYDNAANCGDGSIDQGANYHNGPQWLWLLGPLCRGLYNFNHPKLAAVIERVRKEVGELMSASDGVPELLNGDGSHNQYSCNVQAWSVAQVLEALLLLPQ